MPRRDAKAEDPHATNITIHALGGSLRVAGGDVSTSADPPAAERRLTGILVAFVVSIVAGLVVYDWTVGGLFTGRSSEGAAEDSPGPTAATPEPTDGGVSVDTGPNDPATSEGTVRGCNTYGGNCDGNPIHVQVPPPNYDWASWPTIDRVPNGSVLVARCWAIGATVTNYRVDPPDHGPDPYASDIHFNVQAADGRWGWIPDTYFVRDQGGRMGLQRCSTTA